MTTMDIIWIVIGSLVVLLVLWSVRGHRRSGNDEFYESHEVWPPNGSD